jgi:hypothetical protein
MSARARQRQKDTTARLSSEVQAYRQRNGELEERSKNLADMVSALDDENKFLRQSIVENTGSGTFNSGLTATLPHLQDTGRLNSNSLGAYPQPYDTRRADLLRGIQQAQLPLINLLMSLQNVGMEPPSPAATTLGPAAAVAAAALPPMPQQAMPPQNMPLEMRSLLQYLNAVKARQWASGQGSPKDDDTG